MTLEHALGEVKVKVVVPESPLEVTTGLLSREKSSFPPDARSPGCFARNVCCCPPGEELVTIT